MAARCPGRHRAAGLLFERQVGLYVSVLEAGAAQGAFALQGSAASIASNLVALSTATGCDLRPR